jgi:hypothetical protein
VTLIRAIAASVFITLASACPTQANEHLNFDAHSADEFRDPASIAYVQLIDIVRRLAGKPPPPSIE